MDNIVMDQINMLMPGSTAFLNSLTNPELSFIYVYRYSTFADRGKELLDEEMKKRGLDLLTMQQLVEQTEYQLTNTGCVRCNSNKPLLDNICQVCAHKYIPYKVVKDDEGSALGMIGEILFGILEAFD